MSKRPIRIQGGVFLWVCALLAAAFAVSCVLTSHTGLGKLILAVVISVSIGALVRKIWQCRIERGGSLAEDEEGPLLAMTVASAGISMQCLYAESGPISFVRVFAALLTVSLFAVVAVFTARGLNHFDFRMTCATCVHEYTALGPKSQFVCIALVLTPLLSFIFTLAILVVDGLDGASLAAFTNLIIAMAVFIVCLARMRLKIFRVVGSRYLEHDDLKGAITAVPFVFHEYLASFAAAGLVTLVFLASQRMLVSHYLLVMGLGLLMACLAEAVFIRYDRFRVNGWFRDVWRRNITRKILVGQNEYLQRKREYVSEKVLGAIDIHQFDADLVEDAVVRRAEDIRRTLNYHCCEIGKMKYISSFETVPRGELIRAWVAEKLQMILTLREYDEAACAAASDDQLEILRQTIFSTEPIHVSFAYISVLRDRLLDLMEEVNLLGVVRMKTDLRSRNGEHEITIEVPESGDVRIFNGDRTIVVSSENIVSCVC